MINKEEKSEESEYIDKVHDRIQDILDRFFLRYGDTDVEALVEAMEREHSDEYVGDE